MQNDTGYEGLGVSSAETDRTYEASASTSTRDEKSVPLPSSIEPDGRGHAAPADDTYSAYAVSSDGDLDGQIRFKAYEIFLARDGGPGDAIADWLEAERAVRGSDGAFYDSSSNAEA